MVLTAQNRFLDSRFIVADRVDQDSELCCALFSLRKKIGVPKNRVPVPLGPKRKWSRPPKIGLQTRGSSWPIEQTGTRSSAARLNHKLARRPHQRASTGISCQNGPPPQGQIPLVFCNFENQVETVCVFPFLKPFQRFFNIKTDSTISSRSHTAMFAR